MVRTFIKVAVEALRQECLVIEPEEILLTWISDIKLVYPPKYLAYYPIASESLVRDAQEYVREVIEDEGPFVCADVLCTANLIIN
jgi:hypothetical protein